MTIFKSEKQKEGAKELTKAVAQGFWNFGRALAGPSGGVLYGARDMKESWRRGQQLLREDRQERAKIKR